MLGVTIPEGSLYYGQTRNRLIVSIDEKLRRETERLAERFHDLMTSGITPPPTTGSHCKSCSLAEVCMPELPRNAANYLDKMIAENLK
jgi:CRISPR-associated exonuclease Cas4